MRRFITSPSSWLVASLAVFVAEAFSPSSSHCFTSTDWLQSTYIASKSIRMKQQRLHDTNNHPLLFVPSSSERRLTKRCASNSNNDANGDAIQDAIDIKEAAVLSDTLLPSPAIQSDRKYGHTDTAEAFDAVVNARYACTRFQRYQEEESTSDNNNDSPTTANNSNSSIPTASLSNPTVVRQTQKCIELAQRSPTGFNVQPYRVILVHSKRDKERLAQYCLGRNADRVRDSDCTAVFLADRECGRDGQRFAKFVVENMDDGGDEASIPTADEGDATTTTAKSTTRARRQLDPKALFKLRILILLFSSGYPLPRFLSVPLSFGIRLSVSILSFLQRCLHSLKQSSIKLFASNLPEIQLLPSLFSATTWSQKNTMLIAMTYILACTSRGLASCPMEGFDAVGVRKALDIPQGRRYTIPLIVSTGMPFVRRFDVQVDDETDDVGMSHGGGKSLSPRFSLGEVLFDDTFGKPFGVAAT